VLLDFKPQIHPPLLGILNPTESATPFQARGLLTRLNIIIGSRTQRLRAYLTFTMSLGGQAEAAAAGRASGNMRGRRQAESHADVRSGLRASSSELSRMGQALLFLGINSVRAARTGARVRTPRGTSRLGGQKWSPRGPRFAPIPRAASAWVPNRLCSARLEIT
jgi:hypothetical protein